MREMSTLHWFEFEVEVDYKDKARRFKLIDIPSKQ